MNKAGILVVEDQKIISLEIKERLTDMGYSVLGLAKSGKQAIELASDLDPDLILMDIKLEGSMDGIEAADIIRKQIDCPVIFLTAYADDKTIQRAKITEPYGYIVKPLDERELRSAIEIALYKSRMEKNLKDSEVKYRSIVKTLEGLLYITDSNYNLVLHNINPEGLTNVQDVKCYKYIYQKESPCSHCPIEKLTLGITTRMEIYDSKSSRTFYRVSTPVNLSDETLYFQNYMIDITERKKNEESVVGMLNEKEILLREIQHRVKNNLQIMLSLIRLQQTKAKDNNVKSSLKIIENRLNSIAIVHEDLYSQIELAKIPLNDYVKKLVSNLMLSFSEEKKKIKIIQEIDNVLFPVDLVIPIGIILNELITNSFKHAFPENPGGIINIKTSRKDGYFLLDVSDDGVGIPQGVTIDTPQGMGFQILKSLTKQIDCNLEMSVNNGTCFEISISESKLKGK